jgi:DNA-binding beta-propeller fold protein YncE
MPHRIIFLLLLTLAPCFAFAAEGRPVAIETVAGTGHAGNNGDDGVATQINVDQPFGVEVGPDGAVYITEVGQHRVRRLDLKTGLMTTVAGSGKQGYAGDGGPATKALLNEPYEVRFDPQGNMVFVEMKNHVIRRVDRKTRLITTIAGTGKPGFSGDGGPATEASLREPHSIAVDQAGRIYIADIGNHRVRRIDCQIGHIQTIAGTGEKKLPTSGSAAAGQPILGPRALALAGDSLWIALREGNSVWRLDLSSGIIHHVAGSGKRGFARDGSIACALEAPFDGPKGIAVNRAGNVFVVDTENQAIHEIDPNQGTIRTIAGQGPQARGYAGDGGPAISAKLDRPHGICAASDGALYIGDTNNHRVRRLRP